MLGDSLFIDNLEYDDDREDEEEEEDKFSDEESHNYSSSLEKASFKNYGEDDIEFAKRIPLRASTAPARPLTELEEFRRSQDFLLLENTAMLSSQLKQRSDNKYD